MKIILLDGVGAGFLLFIFLLGLVFIVIAILIEAFVIQRMKYQPTYSKSLVQSLVANLASLAAGFILIRSSGDLFQIDNMAGFAILFVISIAIECLVLFLMNKNVPFIQTLKVSAVMNLVTYAIAVLVILGMGK
jgi:hypothetical protein